MVKQKNVLETITRYLVLSTDGETKDPKPSLK